MRLKCDGCGKKEKVMLHTWWFYFWKRSQVQWDDGVAYRINVFLHLGCWVDMRDQRRMDGLS